MTKMKIQNARKGIAWLIKSGVSVEAMDKEDWTCLWELVPPEDRQHQRSSREKDEFCRDVINAIKKEVRS